MDPIVEGIVWYVSFVFAATLHEAAHALAAKWGGDPTAYEGGQVSIDPLPHVRREPFGMVALPVISLVVMGWPLGFASAPYDPVWADRHPRRAAWMSLAGPGAHLAILLLCAGAIQAGISLGAFAPPDTAFVGQVVSAVEEDGLGATLAFLLSIFFSLNLILCVFNLLPLPPLDGSGALGLVLSEERAREAREAAAQPMVAMAGLLIAWYAFGAVFDPIFLASLNLLYPGAGYH